MGVPFAKADVAASTILEEAKYLDEKLEACDIFDEARANLTEAVGIIQHVLAKPIDWGKRPAD